MADYSDEGAVVERWSMGSTHTQPIPLEAPRWLHEGVPSHLRTELEEVVRLAEERLNELLPDHIAAAAVLDALAPAFSKLWGTASLASGADDPFIEKLPDGRYFDGTYEWYLEEGEWTPLRAPSGMPAAPEREGLRRVVITYEEL